MTNVHRTLPLLVCLALLACGPSIPDPVTDAGAPPVDAGTSPSDAGTSPSDAGTSPSDAGTSPSDAGTTPDAGTSTDAPLPLGTVRVLTRACRQQNAGSACQALSVSCPGLPDREVELKFSEPAAGSTPRGTIVMGSGGNGVGFYLGQEATGQSVRDRLTAAGFRLIERSWAGPEGWYGDNQAGLKVNACRGATLFTWLHTEKQVGPAFCATGNSGGSAEVGYSLTAYGRSEILDLAVPTGGPAVTRLDYLCFGANNPTWLALCPTLTDSRWQCTPQCTLPPTHEVCTTLPSPTETSVRADSVYFEGAQLDYGTMPIHFLYGTADCGPNVPSSRTWAEVVRSPKTIEVVEGMPHPLISSQVGADAVTRVMLDECRPR